MAMQFTSPRQRKAFVASLRERGMTWAQVGDILGVSRQAAHALSRRLGKDAGRPAQTPPRQGWLGELGQALRRHRLGAGIGLNKMAKLVGVPPASLSQAERGIRAMPVHTCLDCCEIIGVDARAIWPRLQPPRPTRHATVGEYFGLGSVYQRSCADSYRAIAGMPTEDGPTAKSRADWFERFSKDVRKWAAYAQMDSADDIVRRHGLRRDAVTRIWGMAAHTVRLEDVTTLAAVLPLVNWPRHRPTTTGSLLQPDRFAAACRTIGVDPLAVLATLKGE